MLLITGVLMGAMLQPYGTHLVERKRTDTRTQLQNIQRALLGFSAANSRLPCPVLDSTAPYGDCSRQHGFVPAALLGIDGRYNEEGLLVDSWGAPFRYSVTSADGNKDGLADFTTAFGMQNTGMPLLSPEFEICDSAADCSELRANQVPVVIYSTGPNATSRSVDESENTDSDTRFVMREPDSAGADQFDDLLVWISENSLYTHLIRAGVLP